MDAYLDGLRRCAFSCVIYAGVPARAFPKGGEGKGPSHALGTLYNLRRPSTNLFISGLPSRWSRITLRRDLFQCLEVLSDYTRISLTSPPLNPHGIQKEETHHPDNPLQLKAPDKAAAQSPCQAHLCSRRAFDCSRGIRRLFREQRHLRLISSCFLCPVFIRST